MPIDGPNTRDWPFSAAVIKAFEETYRDDAERTAAAPRLEEALKTVAGIVGVDTASTAVDALAERVLAEAVSKRGGPEWAEAATGMNFVRRARALLWIADDEMRLRIPREELATMARRGTWPCKIGTVPMMVRVHGSDLGSVAPGRPIRIKDRDGAPWERVVVRRLAGGTDPWFQADRT